MNNTTTEPLSGFYTHREREREREKEQFAKVHNATMHEVKVLLFAVATQGRTHRWKEGWLAWRCLKQNLVNIYALRVLRLRGISIL